jgi:hypothetical protein
MKRGRIIAFTDNADNGVRVYRTGINLRGAKAAQHQLAQYPYHLTIEERCSCGQCVSGFDVAQTFRSAPVQA